MFKTKDASIIMPFKQCHLFVAVFPRFIVFGNCNHDSFVLKQSFIFELCNFKSVFLAIIKILNIFQLDNLEKTTCHQICCHETFSYFWEMKDVFAVKIGIEYNNDIVNSIFLNYDQFNELIYLFKELLLPSLCLKSVHCNFLNKISQLSAIEILELKDDTKLENYIVKNYDDSNTILLKIIFNCNREIVLILSKLHNLVNFEILPNCIDDLF